jgi:hypothetical protein
LNVKNRHFPWSESKKVVIQFKSILTTTVTELYTKSLFLTFKMGDILLCNKLSQLSTDMLYSTHGLHSNLYGHSLLPFSFKNIFLLFPPHVELARILSLLAKNQPKRKAIGQVKQSLSVH